MKSVSLRDFQLKPTEYLSQLPIKLTRYNKTIAYILKSLDNTDNIPKPKNVKLCKHSVPPNLCKHIECRKI